LIQAVSEVKPEDKTTLGVAEVSVATSIDMMSCPNCNAALKADTKLCGICGKSCVADTQCEVLELPVATKEETSEEAKADSKEASVPEMTAAIELPIVGSLVKDIPEPLLPPATDEESTKTVAAESGVTPPHLLARSNQASIKLEAEVLPPKLPVPEPVSEEKKKRPTGLILAIAITFVCAAGGGAYWWFGARVASTTPVVETASKQVLPPVVSAIPTAASQPVAISSVAETVPVVPASQPVASTVSQPVVSPVSKSDVPLVVQPVVPKPPAVHAEKKQKVTAHKGEETNDDRKLLNAIDSYMDKQK
jgi:hypothetical protein